MLTYLGILSAPTPQGRKAVGVSLSNAVEMHHLVDAGLDISIDAVRDWLWMAGVNPEEASDSLSCDQLISEVLIPAIGSDTIVISYSDLDIDLVSGLQKELGRIGNPPIVTGLEVTGPFAQISNGAAGKRAIALQAHYEAALEASERTPLEHVLSGQTNAEGQLTHISVSGPFAAADWALVEPDDGLFALMSLAGLLDRAIFNIAPGAAFNALHQLGEEVGLVQKRAA